MKTDDVKTRWFELAQTAQTRLMTLPVRLAAEFAACTDTHRIRVRLTDEIRTALQELADETRRTAT